MLNNAAKSYTHQEIIQQPGMWSETFTLINALGQQIDRFLAKVLKVDQARVILTGAGSSAFIGDMLAPQLSAILNIPVSSVPTTDIVSCPETSLPRHVPLLLVSFARSGSSPESVETVRLADQLNPQCCHLIITCNKEGSLCTTYRDRPNVLTLLLPDATCDRGFAMTSSLTSMMLACMLAFNPAWRSGNQVAALSESAELVIRQHEQLSVSPLLTEGVNRVIWLGSGLLQGTAHESSLKLLELTAGGIASFYESPLGFRHGPKSLVDAHTQVIVMISNHPHTRKYDLDLFNELGKDGIAARVTALSGQDVEGQPGEIYVLPDAAGFEDSQLAFCFLVYAQYLALSTSLMRGFMPDTPSPGGVVNRVVKGVTIHSLCN